MTYIQKYWLFWHRLFCDFLTPEGWNDTFSLFSNFSDKSDIVSTVKYFWNQVEFSKVNDMIFSLKFSNFTLILQTKVCLEPEKAQIRNMANGLDAEDDWR